MRLATARVTEFQSIQDSNVFEVGDVTCLVGKNEAGKTALLKALYRLKPVIKADGHFDATDDYPRRSLIDYEADVASQRRSPARVVQATYMLEKSDIAAVEERFGPHCLVDQSPCVTLCKGYANKTTFQDLNVDGRATLNHIISTANLPSSLTTALLEKTTVPAMVEMLTTTEQTAAVQRLTPTLQKIAENTISYLVYNSALHDRIPEFLYFDEYYQMKGQDNLEALKARRTNKTLETSDYPLLGLIELAGLNLDQLTDVGRTETLIAKLEAAENQLTQKVLTYWSQNRHLRMKFDLRQAQPEDPEGMQNGMNIWGRVENTTHMVSTPLRTRSRGFVWFFSFLAWYSQFRGQDKNIILLLDEPGLSLHAKAQEDLLRYFEKELIPHHQILYTTHSPFMVDPTRFDRVRIVQDLSVEQNSEDLPEEQEGTKVMTEVLDATSDSLFPLQHALGYEIYQTLFVGPNSLVVEGVSDLLYIQTMSALLQSTGKAGLSADWTITPVGGSDKVATFVAIIGAQTHLNVAVLLDYQKKDRQSIEKLYKTKLLNQRNVLTYADFVARKEADIEDMFHPEFYLQLVNGAFSSSVKISNLPKGSPRILHRLERYLKKNPLPENAGFNHYRPARYLTDHLDILGPDLSGEVLDRFQQAFDRLNALLPASSMKT